jgi:hypothetical protein
MRRIGGASWELDLRPSWTSQTDEECESISLPDGVGALQISTARKDSDVTDDDLQDFAEKDNDAEAELVATQMGAFRGVEFTHDADGTYWRRWYLRNGRIALFATYNCNIDDKGKEDHDVNQMLSSLRTK